ncbi:helix-turn-helix domain-containing protein [Actinokineospora sp. G85]|uniref:helix-turn-helix domain-containing protein n=1 Tax=Actinokineospora sp. G85 TaxID=3406626 RepID=UPI003C73CA30
MERVDPSALRWLIGVELAHYRKQADKSQAETARALGVSAGMIAHFEVGRYFPSPEQIAKMLGFYEAPGHDVKRLSWLAGRADERSWLARWSDVLPDWLRTFIGLEALASHIVTYSPMVLYALVQTREYSAGVTAASARVRADQEDRMVNLRMERQKLVLRDENPTRLTLLLEESVLDRPIGGIDSRQVMRGQLERLLELGKRDNIEILLLPSAIGRHDGLEGKFTLLHFQDSNGQQQAQSVVYVEIPDDSIYIQDQRQVAQYTRNANQLRGVALSEQKSAAAITKRLAALD